MSLTRKEEAFYNSFKELLKREGIDAEHSYRLGEILVIEDYIDDRGELVENVVEPAMFERNNDPHIGRFYEENYSVDSTSLSNALSVLGNLPTANNLSPRDKEFAKEEADEMKQWIARDMKNPFDPKNEPSESLIKNLYRAYKENRLGISNVLTLNATSQASTYNMCRVYEAEDGSMKLSAPSADIEKRYPFSMSELCDRIDLYRRARDNEGCRKMLTEKFGESTVENLATLNIPDDRDIPKRPGFFTKILANWFGHQASKEKVEAFNRYDDALKFYNKIVETIAKEAFPGVKKPLEMVGHFRFDTTSESNSIAFDKYKILQANNMTKAKEEVQNRLNQLTKDRSDVEKDLVKFALESQQDARFPKVIRDFLRDIPDVYKELVGFDSNDAYLNSKNKEFFLRNPEAEKNQKLLAKFAVYKMIVDDLKAGDFRSQVIEAIKNGEGEKLVDAFRVNDTFQKHLTNEEDLKNILTAPATETKSQYSTFQNNLRWNMSDEYGYRPNRENAQKRMEEARSVDPDLSEKEAVEKIEKAANEAKEAAKKAAKEAAKDARVERDAVRIKILKNGKVSFTEKELNQLTETYRADFIETPASVDTFVKWKVYSAAAVYAKNKGNATKNSIDKAMKECREKIEQYPEFAKKLESGEFKSAAAADSEFHNVKLEVNKTEVKNTEENKNLDAIKGQDVPVNGI